MRRVFILLASGVLGSLCSVATPSACGRASLDDYMTLGSEGCVVKNLLFSDFRYSATAQDTEAPSPDEIWIEPSSSALTIPGEPPERFSGDGLTFHLDQFLLPRRLSSDDWILPMLMMNILYSVRGESGITRSAVTAQFSADVLGTSDARQILKDEPCDLYINSVLGPQSETCGIEGAKRVDVTETVALRTGSARGAGGEIRTLDARFSEVPEPLTALLIGSGLLALAWVGRHKLRPRSH